MAIVHTKTILFTICLQPEDDQKNEIDSAIVNLVLYAWNKTNIRTPQQIMEYVDAPFTGRMTIQEAFQITPQEFYDIVVIQQIHPCFHTADQIWRN